MEKFALDEIDRDILREVERDGRISYLDLSQRIALSPNATADRLRRLMRGPLIGFHAEISPEELGYHIQALIELKMRADAQADALEQILETTPGVVEWTLMTGSFDYMLRAICTDQEDLVRLIESLRRSGSVAETQSRIILRSERRPMMQTLDAARTRRKRAQ